MVSNFKDDDDPSLISKKFWTHVKSTSKTTRIPDTVNYRTVDSETIQRIKQNYSMNILKINFLTQVAMTLILTTAMILLMISILVSAESGKY